MTQIKHVTEKEMTRRTGVRNALGYTFPDKDLILLRKGLTGAAKREVLDHEMNHLKKGEEGPFIGSVISGALSIMGSRKQAKAASDASDITREQMEKASKYYKPYRGLGEAGAKSLTDYLYGEGGMGFGPQDPTMEDVTAGEGYKSRLGAIESSAAARGSLFSGNTLRNIGEFGASEFERERARRQQDYQQKLSNMMALVGVGERAAGGSAGIAQSGSNQLANLALQRGQAAAQPYQFGAGLAGQYQGQQDFANMLKQFKG